MKHGHDEKKKVVLSQYQKQLNAMGCPKGLNKQKKGLSSQRFRKRRKAYLREIRRKAISKTYT